MSPSLQPQWDDYELVSILGEGSYGKVYKVKKKGAGSEEKSSLSPVQIAKKA